MIRVRIKATGQVIDLVPAAAVEKLNSGMAELVPIQEESRVAALFSKGAEHVARFLGAR